MAYALAKIHFCSFFRSQDTSGLGRSGGCKMVSLGKLNIIIISLNCCLQKSD